MPQTPPHPRPLSPAVEAIAIFQPLRRGRGEAKRKGELELADRAYKAAFEAEPTNAQILWDRAENLRRIGKTVEATGLFRQIAEGTWQPRFQGLVNQARTQVDGN